MVALMKFTRDICRLLGLGSGKTCPSFLKFLNSAASSAKVISNKYGNETTYDVL